MTKPGQIFEIVRRSLEAGQAVEIEGLGRFHRSAEGYRFDPDTQPTVFVAYALEDLAVVRRLCEALKTAGCSVWLDKDRLMPGQNWTQSIDGAITDADAFVACFSVRSVGKRGQFQSELRRALDCARKRPLDEVFLLPVRLERCSVPARIAEQWQYVDLFPDWERGVKRLVRSIRKAARGRIGARLRPR
ncbi:MAG TPA: toll/interleukin-1 receptor domain-containing protein [Bryobacteraceae bacterium]|nr:toll/interleukin-1 receptor domain-containing protein [Bryobacteraceae bacterium]